MKSPPGRYSMVAMVLHWAIAILLIWNVPIAWNAEDLKGLAHVRALQPHKTIGITVLILSVLRLLWRLAVKPPRMPDTLAPWERRLARVVHVLFYVAIIGLPLSGWAMVSAGKLSDAFPIMLGPVRWPTLPMNAWFGSDVRDVHEALEVVHDLLGKATIYGLIPLHILGALKHQFIDKADELGRMIPFWPRRQAEGHAE
ncbi:MAG TPA: cytochrome b [Caulobacteraceae bacterium]